MTRVITGLGLTLLLATISFGLVGTTRPKVRLEVVAGGGTGPLGGPAQGARLNEPFAVAFDRRGNWYICEYKGHKITRVDRTGLISLFAGRGSDDATSEPRLSSFHEPHGLLITRDQQMLVADTRNHRVVKIDLRTNAASVIAGTGQAGFAGDGGPATAAQFNGVFALALNAAEDKLYITDLANRRIRLLNLKSGIVTTVAGNGQAGVPVDGARAVESPLVDPRAAAVDSQGNLYILERRGNALRVVAPSGYIRTVVGPADSERPPRSATGIERPLNGPKHLCLDRQDNVIIADSENHLIRRYQPKDRLTITLVGTGEKGAQLRPAAPLQTQLNRPHGVYLHPSGALYISDSDNQRILRLTNW